MLRIPSPFSRPATSALAFVVAVAMLVLAPLLAPAARAAAVNGTISDLVVTTTGDVYLNHAVDFSGKWSVPDGSPVGGEFTMQLPAELSWQGPTTFPLVDLNSTEPSPLNIVANASVDDQGLVTFTLTDYVTRFPNSVSGTFDFSTTYTATITDGGEKDLVFELNGEAIPGIPVNLGDPCETDCVGTAPTEAQKYMGWLNPEQTKLLSIIDVPPLTADAEEVVITDTPVAGSTIDCDRVYPAVGVYDNVNGVIPSGQGTTSELYPAEVACGLTSVTVTWKNIPAGNALQVMLWSDVTDFTLPVYENKAVVEIDGEALPDLIAQTQSSRARGTGSGIAAAAPPAPPTDTTVPLASSEAPAPKALAATGSKDITAPLGVGILALALGSALLLTARARSARAQQ